MTGKVLLIDFENLPKVDLAAVPEGVQVYYFFGASQRTVTRELMKAARNLGERFINIDIEGHGKNALDFHIAFYLGKHLANAPDAEYLVLSKDKGFAPLVKHLNGRGHKSLIAHIVTHFKKQNLSVEAVEALIGELLAKKRITEADGKISYNF